MFSTDRSVFLRCFRRQRNLISAVTKYDYRDHIDKIRNEIGKCILQAIVERITNNVKQFYRIVWQRDSFLALSRLKARLAVARFHGHRSKANVLIKGRTLTESNQLTGASFVLGVGWKCVPSDTNDRLPVGWQWKSEIGLDLRMATVLPSGTEVAPAPGFFHQRNVSNARGSDESNSPCRRSIKKFNAERLRYNTDLPIAVPFVLHSYFPFSTSFFSYNIRDTNSVRISYAVFKFCLHVA